MSVCSKTQMPSTRRKIEALPASTLPATSSPRAPTIATGSPGSPRSAGSSIATERPNESPAAPSGSPSAASGAHADSPLRWKIHAAPRSTCPSMFAPGAPTTIHDPAAATDRPASSPAAASGQASVASSTGGVAAAAVATAATRRSSTRRWLMTWSVVVPSLKSTVAIRFTVQPAKNRRPPTPRTAPTVGGARDFEMSDQRRRRRAAAAPARPSKAIAPGAGTAT